MGLILISHDLDLVARYCDRILVMNAGRGGGVRGRGTARAQHPYTRGLSPPCRG
jgi:peptide/nickel transport system ATP-binding protein